MTSFAEWNETVKEGILATKDSFATTHPILTGLVLACIVFGLFLLWAWQFNRLENKKEGRT